jgi:hypothetical protein
MCGFLCISFFSLYEKNDSYISSGRTRLWPGGKGGTVAPCQPRFESHGAEFGVLVDFFYKKLYYQVLVSRMVLFFYISSGHSAIAVTDEEVLSLGVLETRSRRRIERRVSCIVHRRTRRGCYR